MNKFIGALVVAVAVLPGCGKKKGAHKPSKADKELAMEQDLQNAVFDNSDSFAFVDGNTDSKVAQALGEDGDVVALRSELDDADFAPVQFGFDTDKLAQQHQAVLHEDINHAKEVIAQGNDVKVSGFACEMGEPVYNMALSQKRADAIKKEMVNHGLDKSKIHAVGCGQENPVVRMADLSDDEISNRATKIKKLAPSRRAEFTVVPSAA
jgi:outer membrane protein OmpA-like peptidoglycan-associated protein